MGRLGIRRTRLRGGGNRAITLFRVCVDKGVAKKVCEEVEGCGEFVVFLV
jgi:hypothetical protein